jgi:amino acid transporter
VLGGHVPSIENPGHNFDDAFAGTTNNGNRLANALVSIIFSYSGYANAFNVVSEIKNPIPSLKKHGVISVMVVTILYMLCNIAYFAAVDKAEFSQSSEIAAAVFFRTVFGKGRAETALNVLVLLSAFGNLLAVLIGQSRLIREIGRQGVLPFPKFFTSTRPFGTPLGPYALKWAFTVIMCLAPPAGDAFQFVVSLKTYPEAIFHLFMAAGVYVIRRRRARNNIPRSEFRGWDVALIFFILIQIYTLVMPWIPPEKGIYGGDVSFFYATYMLTGIAM